MTVRTMTSSSASAAVAGGAGRLGSDEVYAAAMHSILSSEPCRGLVTEPTRLLPHVYIGSQANAEDLAVMRRIGITHVLNCAGYKGPRPSPDASPYQGLGIAYYEFKAEDNDRYDITKHFNEAFRFVDAAKRDGGIALVHCALGINRSAAVCLAYMMTERRLPLLAVTRIIKDRRRIVLANKAFQRQLVGFARSRGLLGELPSTDENGKMTYDDELALSGMVRRLTLHDRHASNGQLPGGGDWKLDGLRFYATGGASQRSDIHRARSERSTDNWRKRSDDLRISAKSPSRYNHLLAGGADFSPQRKSTTWLSSRSATPKFREPDDFATSVVHVPRQYRASKSATNLLPVSSSVRATARTAPTVQSRSSSASRFSLGFL